MCKRDGLVTMVTVVGAFEDEEVTHVDGDINPVRDMETIHDELRLKDIQYCNNRLVSYIVYINLSLMVVCFDTYSVTFRSSWISWLPVATIKQRSRNL